MADENRENLHRAAKLVQQFLAGVPTERLVERRVCQQRHRSESRGLRRGACFVTAARIRCIWSSDWRRRQIKAFEKASPHPSETENDSPSGSA